MISCLGETRLLTFLLQVSERSPSVPIPFSPVKSSFSPLHSNNPRLAQAKHRPTASLNANPRARVVALRDLFTCLSVHHWRPTPPSQTPLHNHLPPFSTSNFASCLSQHYRTASPSILPRGCALSLGLFPSQRTSIASICCPLESYPASELPIYIASSDVYALTVVSPSSRSRSPPAGKTHKSTTRLKNDT
jgi:hypothetical protein